MAVSKAHINPEILRWAREEAGLSLEDAAIKTSINDTRLLTAGERIALWEQGDDVPTKNQLASLAKIYYRPVLTFYMKSPPVKSREIADFRTVGNHPDPQRGVLLSALIRKLKAKQQELVELISDDVTDIKPLSFIGRFGADTEPKVIAADIRKTLGFSFDDQRQIKNPDSLFKEIRREVEELGVFVLLQNNLGSYHTNMEVDEFRGIALASPVAPLIVINGQDAKAAHTFTLLHELAHIWMGETGISNSDPFGQGGADQDIEAVCNQVAAEFLIPEDAMQIEWENATTEKNLHDVVANIARNLKVSRAATANRLWKLGYISEEAWWELYSTYQNEWQRRRRAMQDRDGGPDYHVTKHAQLGNSIIRTVLGAVDAGNLTYTRASRILGVNAKNFDGLRDKAFS